MSGNLESYEVSSSYLGRVAKEIELEAFITFRQEITLRRDRLVPVTEQMYCRTRKHRGVSANMAHTWFVISHLRL